MLSPLPRRGAGQDNAELEALQTDVMRFVAIIGLCLAAIFSLLQGLDSATPPAPVPPSPALEPEQTPLDSQPEPPLPATSPGQPGTTPPATTSDGFSLRFASEQALFALLASGQVSLYASSGKQHWAFRPGPVDFKPAAAPASLYLMEAATVPSRLRAWLQAAGIEVDAWGVMLPASVQQQLQALMQANSGGELLIAADGLVALSPTAP